MSSNLTEDNHGRFAKFQESDIAIIGLYFVALLVIGICAMYNANRGTISGYFLAGRFITWLPIGASIFASNIGSEHFIGLAGSGAATGIGVGAFELNAIIILQITAWVFLPVFIASRVCTLPEYMSRRFGRERIRTYLAVLSLILYIFTKISVNLYSGAIFIREALGWNLWLSVGILLAMTALCTITGGLTSVIYTDTIQCTVMVIGSVLIGILAFEKVGGYPGLVDKYPYAYPKNVSSQYEPCVKPRPDAFILLREADDPDLPWPGFIFGQTPASIWYWCTDQMIVQRLLAAKTLSHAQGGTILAGYLKILPFFFIIMPGMISRVLNPDIIACGDPDTCESMCHSRVSCSNIAYPTLVLLHMPSPLKGLILSVMLAALMSDLTSVFNSGSTLFTCDIWPLFRKNATVKELMVVGRSFVLVMTLASIAWMPVIQSMHGGQLYIYIQAISAYLSPPIAAVYVLAVLWPRMNETGAFWSLCFGFVMGFIRMLVDFILIPPPCGHEDARHFLIRNVHYMYYAMFLFWGTGLVAAIISYSTPPPDEVLLIRTTFWTRYDTREREDAKEAIKKQHRPASVKENGEREEVEIKKWGCCGGFCTWICGLDESAGPGHLTASEASKMEEEHLNDISMLCQPPWERAILQICLSFMIGVALVIYIYFTIPLDWR